MQFSVTYLRRKRNNKKVLHVKRRVNEWKTECTVPMSCLLMILFAGFIFEATQFMLILFGTGDLH